jgi:hypothetical protein
MGWAVVSTVWSAVVMARLTSKPFSTSSSASAYWSGPRAAIAWGYFPTQSFICGGLP